MGHLIPLLPAGGRPPKPDWLKVRAPGSPNYTRLKGLMRDLGLHTVCEEAQCPNIGECWHHGTATFMILGEVCTRACAYCAVSHGRPAAADPGEAARVGHAIETLGLTYVVITSVDRDDLPDGGAAIFADTIRETRARRGVGRRRRRVARGRRFSGWSGRWVDHRGHRRDRSGRDIGGGHFQLHHHRYGHEPLGNDTASSTPR